MPTVRATFGIYRERLAAHPYLVVPAALLALTLLMFGNILFVQKDTLLSAPGTDVATNFLYSRDYGFSHLRQGEVPLWNPHVFSGTPFLGGFQAALFYPPNWIYLILPLRTAINLEFVLAIYFTGFWMCLWTLRRGLHPIASLVASALLMFSAPYMLRIYAGHLAPLDAMSWVPAILFAVEGLFAARPWGWALLGMAAAGMQILAGHPQTVFNTGIAAGIYILLRMIRAEARWKPILGFGAMYLGAAALAAIQLLPGLQAAGEGARHGGVPYPFAATFSLPPENFLTLLMPGFFGNVTSAPYWGGNYLWEMSLFFGVFGLALAIYGAAWGAAGERHLLTLTALLLLWIALGEYTPLFRLLYDHLPGFNEFRGHSKFAIQAAAFLALLAGIGLDALFLAARSTRRMAAALLAAALLAGALGLSLNFGAGGWWPRVLARVAATRESYLSPHAYTDPKFIHAAAVFAAGSCFLCCGLLCLVALLFFCRKFSRNTAFLTAAVAVIEIFVYAQTTLTTFQPPAAPTTQMAAYLAQHPGDYRILQLAFPPESALSNGACDLWGYDPIVTGRYAEFMAMSQGLSPDTPPSAVTISYAPRLFRMLRCRYVFLPETDRLQVLHLRNPLPRLLLVQNWSLIRSRDRIFAALKAPGFDPAREVILEAPPVPAPAAAAQTGSVSLLQTTTDSLTVEAALPQPGILLLTDAYSPNWRVVALPGSVQQSYRIQPANYTLEAIPLAAGKHRFRVEYSPVVFQTGERVTLTALLLYVVLLGLYLRTLRGAQKRQS